MAKDDQSKVLFTKLSNNYNERKAKGKSLLGTLFGDFPIKYWLTAIPLSFSVAVQYIYPEILGDFLNYIWIRGTPLDDKGEYYGWISVGLFVLLFFINSIGEQIMHSTVVLQAINRRVGITALLYNKLLSIREVTRQHLSAGNLINLMFTDASRIQNATIYTLYLIFFPIEIGVGVWRMFSTIGKAAFASFGFLLLCVFLFTLCGQIMMKVRVKMMRCSDERVRRMTEILNGMRVVKVFGTEEIFYERVYSSRDFEVKQLKKFGIAQLSLMTLVNAILPLTLMVTLVIYVYVEGKDLTSGLVYQTMSLLNVLRFPFALLPTIIVSFQDMIVSARRMEALLNVPDGDKQMFRKLPKESATTLSRKDDSSSMHDLRESSGSTESDSSSVSVPEAPRPIAIDIPQPVSFSWANAQDRDVPPILDPNAKKKLAALKKQMKAERKTIASILKKNKRKQPQAWEEYRELVGDRADLSEESPQRIEEVVSFRQWLETNFSREEDEVPLPEIPKALPPVLVNISMQIKEGEVVGVFGKVGCGKSSLINAILGELRAVGPRDRFDTRVNLSKSPTPTEASGRSGDDIRASESDSSSASDPETPAEQPFSFDFTRLSPIPEGVPLVTTRGRIAFCAQSAWILNSTIRENITFGLPYNPVFYQQVVSACCLLPDFAQFTAGDMTEVGERGITLSGGQKHRIALARAVYSDADIFLLDDPLSAVDAHVGRRIFEDVICGILKNKTIFLVTHQTQYLPNTDKVILLEDGEIRMMGTFDELMSSGYELHGMSTDPSKVVSRAMTPEESEASSSDSSEGSELAAEHSSDGKIVKDETKDHGRLSISVPIKYLRSGGSLMKFFLILFVFLICYAFLWAADYSLAQWSAGELLKSPLAYYGGFTGGFLVFTFIGSITLVFLCIKASKLLHMKLVKSTLRAPMSFFDTTPVGRIINRFSKDTDSSDLLIPLYLSMLISIVFGLVEMLAIMAYSNPYVIIVIVVIAFLFFLVFIRFRATARELRRLDNISRSPVLALTNETLNGITTIRSYDQEATFSNRFFKTLDGNTAANYPYSVASKWLSIRLDLISILLIFSMSALCLLPTKYGEMKTMAGAALTYCFSIPFMVRNVITSFITLEAEFSSVERILDYKENLPREPPRRVDPAIVQISRNWPQTGKLEFTNVSMRYRPELPLVLKDIDITIHHGEKIGVVGRTGAGKTSLTASLLRLVECEPDSQILLDGIDLLSVGVHDTRKNIAVIPQDAFLFSGTLRANLDSAFFIIDETVAHKQRSKKHCSDEKLKKVRQRAYEDVVRRLGRKPASDDVMWTALDRCLLGDTFRAHPEGLDFVLKDNGENLSAGERQLVCLAKALLLDTKIIVMDEATAQVDSKSDEAVQRVIREAFADRTILCIAHRLGTIIDFDRIVVMDDGRVAEFDSPHTLLQRHDSLLSLLVDETGDETSAFLRRTAAEAASRR
eukprot:gnl/Chilomastix_cuspidata/720.p1 GENE.gnl/Chilomastix_cuspidata/720~~gnl/Chilomastix_cuspidata/720.p1  ORF type:complete len:1567 (-),score=246.90 gnl/Chilomastix_cuspidata/720:33-4403(-)